MSCLAKRICFCSKDVALASFWGTTLGARRRPFDRSWPDRKGAGKGMGGPPGLPVAPEDKVCYYSQQVGHIAKDCL